MTEVRRGAVRLIRAEPGMVSFSRRSAPCVILDLSVTGARVRLTPPQLISDRIALTTTVAGKEITLESEVRRGEPHGLIAVSFLDAEAAGLPRLIAEEQRQAVVKGQRTSVERRRTPRAD